MSPRLVTKRMLNFHFLSGKLHFDPKFGIDPIPYQDHQDKMSDGKTEEERQCLPLHVGIGIRRAKHPSAPDAESLQAAADLRQSMWQEAVAAQLPGRSSRMDHGDGTFSQAEHP